MKQDDVRQDEFKEIDPGFLLVRIFFASKALMRRMLQESGMQLTPEQASLVQQLSGVEGINQRELAAHMIKDVAAITRLVDALEKKDLVRRMPDPHDRRSHRLALTKSGKAKAMQIRDLQSALRKKVLACFSQKETAALVKQLSRLKEHLDILLAT